MEDSVLSEVAGRASEAASAVRDQVKKARKPVIKAVSAASERASTQLMDFTRNNPPRAALTALGVGAVLGWVAGRILKG